MRRCVVLGSNSFAGAAFVARALKDGSSVLGVSRSPEGSPIFLPYRELPQADRYVFMQADINRDLVAIAAEIEKFRPETIVDFAGQSMVAESWDAPAQWYETNIVAKVKLHDRLRRLPWLKRYIKISTPEVYGSQDARQRETLQTSPSTPYAVSHAAIDASLRAFHQQYGFPVVTGRFANFYGPGQQLYRIVPKTIIYALSGRKLPLHGGGTSVRAFIYSDDVAEAINRLIATGEPGQIYHFSPDRFLTIRNVVEIISEQLSIDPAQVIENAPERPGKDHAYLMDASYARERLGWKDQILFEEGVDKTIAWVKTNFDTIKTLPMEYIHKQ